MSGAELLRIRRRLGLTQREMAGELGLHPNTYARQERGEVGIGGSTVKLARLIGRLATKNPQTPDRRKGRRR